MTHAKRVPLSRRRFGYIFSIERQRTLTCSSQTTDRLYEFGLTIALHAGNTNYLACPNIERNVFDYQAAVWVNDAQVFYIEHNLLR
jgi:hypothetical protein